MVLDVPDLPAALTALVQQIPRGRVATFGDVAAALGDRTAARWVARTLQGQAHRVVKVTGQLSCAFDVQQRLAAEGVPVDDGRVQLDAIRFTNFVGEAPLSQLREAQTAIAARVRLEPLPEPPATVAAIDVSYRSDGTGVGAYVLMEPDNPAPLWTTTAALPVAFPYIPGYLSFRELPVVLALQRLAEVADRLAPLILVDGQGLLHPRRCGIATQFGVLCDCPSVGVGKSLLCGTVSWDGAFGSGTGTVMHQGERLAAALLPPRGSKPIYISPGHRCTLEDAVAAVRRFHTHRLPEPIRRADALSRAVARSGA